MKGKRLMQPVLVTFSSTNLFFPATAMSLNSMSEWSRHSSSIFCRICSLRLRQYLIGLGRPRYSATFSSPYEKRQIQDMRSTCCLDSCWLCYIRGQSSRPLPMKLPRSQSSLQRQRYLTDLLMASSSIRSLWLCVSTKYRYHFSSFQKLSRSICLRLRAVDSSRTPCSAWRMRVRRGRTRVGGFISKMSWQMNLTYGIMLLISAPLICSRPIQPKRSILRIQLQRTSMARSGRQCRATERWKPSSQRKPRGKMRREGVKVQEQSSSCLRREFWVQSTPKQNDIPPYRLNSTCLRKEECCSCWGAAKRLALMCLLLQLKLVRLNEWEWLETVMVLDSLNSLQKKRVAKFQFSHLFIFISFTWLSSHSCISVWFVRRTLLNLLSSTRCLNSQLIDLMAWLSEMFMPNPNTFIGCSECTVTVSEGLLTLAMLTVIWFGSCLLTDRWMGEAQSLWLTMPGSLFSTVMYVNQYTVWFALREAEGASRLMLMRSAHPSALNWYMASVWVWWVESLMVWWAWLSPSWLTICTYSPLRVVSYWSRLGLKYSRVGEAASLSQYPMPQLRETGRRSPRWNSRWGLLSPKSLRLETAASRSRSSIPSLIRIIIKLTSYVPTSSQQWLSQY